MTRSLLPPTSSARGARGARRRWSVALAAVVLAALVGVTACEQEEENAESVPVLLYHKVSPDPEAPGDHTLVHRDSFIRQMQYLADEGYTTATVGELVEYMNGERTLPPRTVVLTFDDAWNSVLHAIPILDKHGFKATFGIATGPVSRGYPAYLTWPEIEGLARNPRFEFAAHSVTHPWEVGNNLVAWTAGETTGKGPMDAAYEMQQSKQILEQRIGRPVTLFAWPSGWYNEELMEMARNAGFVGLLTTDEKLNAPGEDPMRIGRLPVYGQFGMEEFRRVLAGDFSSTVIELLPEGEAPSDRLIGVEN